MIAYNCPKCLAAMASPESLAGGADKCPACGATVPVPAGQAGVAALAAEVAKRAEAASIPRPQVAPEKRRPLRCSRIEGVCVLLGIGAILVIGVAIVGTVWALTAGISEWFWLGYWRFKVILGICLAVVTSVWFTVGGLGDVRRMFRDLRAIARNDRDDGRVVDHHNLADEASTGAADKPPEDR